MGWFAPGLVGILLGAVVVASCSFSSLDDLRGNVAGPDGGGSSGVDAGDAAGGISSDAWVCVPKTCKTAGAECGQIANGCNGVVECGDCPTGKVCGGAGANHCGDAPCTPKTCAGISAECGTASDGCGATLDCGDCTSPNTCNASNQCECVPASCSALGKQCGSAPDGCGGTLDCGVCGGTQTCSNGQCVCAPKTCASVGWSCGALDDGCGGQVSCGVCPGATTCLNHTCQQGLVLACGACPVGYSSPFGVSNSICAPQSFCGQVVQSVCVLAGATYSSGCGAQCPPQFHLAANLQHCACPSTVNFCLPD